MAMTGGKDLSHAEHCGVVDDSNRYNNDDHDEDVYNDKDHVNDRWKGGCQWRF